MSNDTSRIVTDMNDRERERFANSLEQIAKEAALSVEALRSGDDTALMPHLLILMLGFPVMSDLMKVLQTIQFVDVGDLDKPMEDKKE